jgi:hypothetical protein
MIYIKNTPDVVEGIWGVCFCGDPRFGTFDTSEAFFLRFRRVKGTETASEHFYTG